jgi:outer membrane immunogenic protein
MNKILYGLLGATLLIATPAAAADLGRPVYKAPVAVMAPATNWNGFYIGAHGGYGSGDSQFDFATNGYYNDAVGDRVSHGMRGGLAGGHAGYNWQWGSTVLGLEASGTWSGVKRDNIQSPFFAEDRFSTRVEWISTVTPRLGLAGSNWLFYVKGGVAFAGIEGSVQDTAPPVRSIDRRSATRTGWTVGGGAEYMVTSNWVVGIEGNYYDFGRCCGGPRMSVDSDTGAPLARNSDHSFKTNMWSVLGRVSYKFGGPVVAAY